MWFYGCYSFRPENGYWYDISDEEKLEKVLTKLKEKTKEYVLSITDKFEEDDEAALEFLANPKIREWSFFYRNTREDPGCIPLKMRMPLKK